MINIYSPASNDWSSNGLAVLLPTECKIGEAAGGNYDLVMTHPVTDDMRWKTITEGCIVKAPVPACETPSIELKVKGIPGVDPVPGRIIYKVNVTSELGSRDIPGGPYAICYDRPQLFAHWVASLREGTEYEFLNLSGNDWVPGTNWHVMVTDNGSKGYIYAANGTYVRTEEATGGRPGVPGYSTVVKPRQIRTQLFRLYKVELNTEKTAVTAYGRHISYDLMGNITGDFKLNKVTLPNALSAFKSSLMTTENRQLIANFSPNITGEWPFENGIKVLLDPEEGFVAKAKCKITRDNNDIFLLENISYNRGVVISYGKNLKGVTWTKNIENLVTRIVPLGQDAEGKSITLPEKYIDSAYISSYPVIHTQKLDVSDAKVSDTMTLQQAYTKMREAAQAEFAKGCDLIDFTLDVDFIQLGDTEEYKQYKNLQQVFLYDTVTIKHELYGFTATAQIKGYEWDAITQTYTDVTIGDIFEVEGGGIAGYQLPNAGIAGYKIVPGSVGGNQLRDLSVTSAKIGLAAIDTANIKTAAIKTALIEDGTIINAKIADGTIENAKIADATIENAKIKDATIDTAKIKNAAITNAKIADGTIENAKIKDATIDTAKIKDAAITSAKIGDAQINDAHIISVAAGKITAGTIDAQVVTIDNLSADSITSGTIDADFVAVKNIDAAEITTGKIKSSQMEAGTITAVSGILADAVIGDAQIDTANISNLKAAVIDAFTARIQNLIAGDLITDELYAALADISSATVDVADINWANIKDLVTDTAILTQGAGGKFYFSELAISEANIVNLSVGELMVKGEDGHFYTVSVDELGNVVTTRKLVVGDDINNVTIDADTKVIEGSITAKTLNAQDIFANNAVIADLIAANLNVDTLFARKGTINEVSIGEVIALNDTIKTSFGDLQRDFDSMVDDVDAERKLTESYIINGYLYDDPADGLPRHGIGIGTDLVEYVEVEGVLQRIIKPGNYFATFTSDRINFWQGGVIVAYFSNNELYITESTVLTSMRLGNWVTDHTDGYVIRWAGN